MATNGTGVGGRVLAAAVCLALLAGCEKSMEEVVAAHRAPVEKVFGQLKALEPAAVGAPDVAEDRIETGGATIILDADEGEQTNALYILADDLDTPETATDDGFGLLHASTINACAEALSGDFDGVAGGADLSLADCGRAEYVFVLRKHDEQYASVVGNDSFTPGVFDGDLSLYRLADGASLGGFRVHAASSDTVQVLVDESGTPIDPTERLNSDLSSMVFAAIQEGLRKHVPGSIPDA